MLTISAHKGTARSWQHSPQYHMITQRRSSWQASSGSTAAEPNPVPQDLQAHSWKHSWSKTAADKITPCTARRHWRGGWQREMDCEKQCGCLGSMEEKALPASSERDCEDPHQLLILDKRHWRTEQLIL